MPEIPPLSQLGLQMGVCLDSNEVEEQRKPIFLHKTGTGGPAYVSKGDRHGPQFTVQKARESIAVAIEMYSVVTDGLPKHRVLNLFDIMTLKDLIPERFREYITDERISRQYFWIVMEAVANLKTLSDLVDPAKDGDRIVEFLRRSIVREPNMMKVLGQILMMDLFYGNTDRFWKNEAGVWVIQNIGNIFLVAPEGKNPAFVALDFYDPSNYFKGLEESLEDQLAMTPEAYPGMILAKGSTKERDALAPKIIESLNEKGRPKGLVFTNKHAKKLRDGMHTGRERLMDYFKNKKKRKGYIPKGIQDRITVLGW